MGQATRHISPAKKTIPGKSVELSVVIPCAGIGKRLKSKDAKGLCDLHGTTLIEKQLQTIWGVYPRADVFVTIGYQAERFRKLLAKYPVRFIYNPIYDKTNVAFSIALALQATISNQVLLIYGDLVFNDAAISMMTAGKSKVLVDSEGSFKDEEVGIVTDEDNHISNFAYGLDRKWAQITYLKDKELELLKSACYDDDTSTWLGYELLNKVIDKGGVVDSLSVHTARVCDIDVPQDLEKALTIG